MSATLAEAAPGNLGALAPMPGPSTDEAVRTMRSAPLRVGVSSRAIFDLREEHDAFETRGVEAYVRLQAEREDAIMRPGAAIAVVRRLLALNPADGPPFVEAVLLSRNAPDCAPRIFRSLEAHGIGIFAGSFTGGRSLGPYVAAWDLDLLLSNEAADVQEAIEGGAAGAVLAAAPATWPVSNKHEVRIAFDADGVLVGAESDDIHEKHGLQAFIAHERANAAEPLKAGPFLGLLRKLDVLRRAVVDRQGRSRLRVAVVTARGGSSHERLVRTLRAWNTPVDEIHLVAGRDKAPFLRALKPDLFVDDREGHVRSAAAFVPAGLVPRRRASRANS